MLGDGHSTSMVLQKEGPQVVRPQSVRRQTVRPQVVRPQSVRRQTVRPQTVRPQTVRSQAGGSWSGHRPQGQVLAAPDRDQRSNVIRDELWTWWQQAPGDHYLTRHSDGDPDFQCSKPGLSCDQCADRVYQRVHE